MHVCERLASIMHIHSASDRRPAVTERTTDQTANGPAKSRGTDATSSPSGNESGNLRRQRVRAVWPLRVEEQCGACLTRRGIRAASSLPSKNTPTKTLTATHSESSNGSLSDVFKGDAMQAIQFRNQLQRKARERAQRIREARLAGGGK